MKASHLILLVSSFSASASAATWLYTDSTAFFNSSTWTGAAAGSAVTENFVASGGVHNFTGNEQFNSNSYIYGTGTQQNTVTYTRSAGRDILVDTTNELGGFRSFDAPGSSKYLYVPASGQGDMVTITFSEPISSFGFRLGDFGDSTGVGNHWSDLRISAANSQTSTNQYLAYQMYVDVATNTGSNIYNSLNLLNTFSAENYFSAGSSTIIIGDKNWAFMGWTFDTPVNSITIDQFYVGSNDSWGIDTVSFTTVPEPGAVLLGGVGLLTLLRRRRS
jgi:MYXO-CTERM domain-containing protein